MVDTADLKSVSFKGVPVQVRQGAPFWHCRIGKIKLNNTVFEFVSQGHRPGISVGLEYEYFALFILANTVVIYSAYTGRIVDMLYSTKSWEREGWVSDRLNELNNIQPDPAMPSMLDMES